MKSVAEINEIIEGSSEIRARVAGELTSGWPIPHVTDEANHAVLVFYFAMHLPPPQDEFKVYPPNWFVVLNADSGKILKLEKKPPIHYGIDVPPDKPFANFKYTHPFDGNELDEKVRSFCAIYTKVLSAWFLGENNLSNEIRDSFRRNFHWFVPSPTQRIYRHLHRKFAEFCGI